MNIDLKLAMEELKKNGIVFENEKDLLKNIALKNKKTPKDIYGMVEKFKIKEGQFLNYSPGDVDGKFSGT